MLILNRAEAMQLVDARRDRLDAAAVDNPFAGADWTRLFLGQVATDEWTIVVPDQAGADGRFMLLHAPGRDTRRLAALANYYASLYSPLPGAAPLADGAREVVRQIDAARPRHAAVTLAPLDADAAATAGLAAAFRDAGWFVRRYFCFGNWYLPCDGLAFADYMAQRDSQLFNTWKRKAKRFRAGTDGARLQLVDDPADVDAGMAAYEQVYARSWKVPEPFPEFVRGWARICARHGWLRLGLAWLGDTPIAAQFWFTLNRRAYIFKLAYDEAHAKLSAGTVLSALLFEQSLDRDRVVEIDYLTGDDPYKKAWVSHRRERVGLIACNPRTPEGLALAAREWAGALRQRWRR